MPGNYPAKRLGPALGICNKIGFIFFTLLITLLRLAELFFVPQWSLMPEPIIQTICYAYQKYTLWSMLVFFNIYHPIGELLLFFIPSILISSVLWIWMNLILSDSLDKLVNDVPAILLEITCCQQPHNI